MKQIVLSNSFHEFQSSTNDQKNKTQTYIFLSDITSLNMSLLS